MDWQSAFNIAFAIGGALGGWVLKTLHAEIKDARNDHANLAKTLPETYARRDDVRDGFKSINEALGRPLPKRKRRGVPEMERPVIDWVVTLDGPRPQVLRA